MEKRVQPVDDPPKLETMSEGMAGAPNYYDWIYAALKSHLGSAILEIGPGYGAFAERILRDKKEYFAVDFEQKVIERLKNTIPIDPSRLIVGDVSHPNWIDHFKKAGVDTILSMNVLEHIENDVEHLKTAAKSAPGGRMVLFVPAMPALYGTFDREAGHFRRYDSAQLKEVVSKAGLTLRHISYFNALGAIAWFFSTKVFRLHMHSGGTIRSIHLYDKAVIPLGRLLDPLLNSFWGQSLLAVADIPR